MKGSLYIHGKLQKAGCIAKSPTFVRAPANAIQRAGLRYERLVSEAISQAGPTVIRNPWFNYIDSLGSRVCSPDCVVDDGSGILVVVECKLTFVPNAQAKLMNLYVPIVEQIFGKPARGLVVCKHLGSAPLPNLVLCLSEAANWRVATFQWLGRERIIWPTDMNIAAAT